MAILMLGTYKVGLSLLILAFGLLATPFSLAAQTPVLEGKGMFQQRCAVCHLPLVVDDDRTYGPKLNAETVSGREDIIRQFIRRGSLRMPGFQYGLRAEEIDNIIEYLKTVPKVEAE